MLVADAQRHVRTAFLGGFWGQLVSSAIWLASAALATWSTPRAAISTIVIGGFFIFPATVLLLRLTGAPASPTQGNPLSSLGMQIAFTLPMTMLLLVPVTEFRLNLFYPALLILLGAHYLPVCLSLRHAHIYRLVRHPRVKRRRHRALSSSVLLARRLGRRPYASCFCRAWPRHCPTRTARQCLNDRNSVSAICGILLKRARSSAG